MEAYAWFWFIIWAFLLVVTFLVLMSWSRIRRGGGRGMGYPDSGTRDFPGGYGAPYGPYVGRGPRGYRRSDERIADEISDRLTQHGEVDASDIEISIKEGEVTLRGTVDSRRQRRLSEEIAESVSGVTNVKNEIRIERRMERKSAA